MHFPIILSLKCRRHRILFDSSRVRVTWSDSIFICSVIPKIQYFHTEIYTFRNSKWAHIPPSSLFPNHRYGRCKRWLTRFINTFFLTFHAAGFVPFNFWIYFGLLHWWRSWVMTWLPTIITNIFWSVFIRTRWPAVSKTWTVKTAVLVGGFRIVRVRLRFGCISFRFDFSFGCTHCLSLLKHIGRIFQFT